jgi:periplasmic divalent cation tolerance protein
MTDKIVVLSTCETAAEAKRIADVLVGDQLAACVNIVTGVESVYRWKGEVESAAEVMLIIKTSRELLPQIEATLARMHTYELPECIALTVVDGSERYLEWLTQGVKHSQPSPR